MKRIVVGVTVFAAVVTLVACGGGQDQSSGGQDQSSGGQNQSAPAGSDSSSSGKRVSRSDYGKDWPLKVESGTLSCNDGAVTFTSNEGKIYWVNGTAGNQAAEQGWQDIHPIWAKNPDPYSGPKKYIGPLIDDGLALCGQ
jgi:hypothetical protein